MRLTLSEITGFRSHPCVTRTDMGQYFGLQFWCVSNSGGGDHVAVETLRTVTGLPAGRAYECINLRDVARDHGEFSKAAARLAARMIWEGKVSLMHAWAAPRQINRIARNFAPERLPA